MREAKKLTQSERVLDYIKEFGSITQLDAIRDLGIMRLASDPSGFGPPLLPSVKALSFYEK